MTVESEPRPAEQQEQEHRHGHQHGPHCYWDLRVCRWVCADEGSVTEG